MRYKQFGWKMPNAGGPYYKGKVRKIRPSELSYQLAGYALGLGLSYAIEQGITHHKTVIRGVKRANRKVHRAGRKVNRYVARHKNTKIHRPHKNTYHGRPPGSGNKHRDSHGRFA